MKKLAIKAARWWKNQLSTDNISKYKSKGDNDIGAIFNYLLQDKIENGMLQKFEELLTNEIYDALLKEGNIHLDCIYYPCSMLERCGNQAGFNGLCFPWNTYMIIDQKQILVKDNKSEEFKPLV